MSTPFNSLYSGEGYHNSIARGKNLGTSVTAEQWAEIAAGTFNDMFIGDYWNINSKIYRIAHFNYWLRKGDTECTTPHVVLVPDATMVNAKMNSSNTTAGGYMGSGFYTGTNADESENTARATCIATVEAEFGASHILTHRERLSNAVSNGIESETTWVDSQLELMTEEMVYGSRQCVSATPVLGGTYKIDYAQLQLFNLMPSKICNRSYWWLRSVSTSTGFALVSNLGSCHYYSASGTGGVRPAFAIK